MILGKLKKINKEDITNDDRAEAKSEKIKRIEEKKQ